MSFRQLKCQVQSADNLQEQCHLRHCVQNALRTMSKKGHDLQQSQQVSSINCWENSNSNLKCHEEKKFSTVNSSSWRFVYIVAHDWSVPADRFLVFLVEWIGQWKKKALKHHLFNFLIWMKNNVCFRLNNLTWLKFWLPKPNLDSNPV